MRWLPAYDALKTAVTAQIALSISRLRDSNAELAAVLDSSSAEDDFSDSDRAEFAASIAENEDFMCVSGRGRAS